MEAPDPEHIYEGEDGHTYYRFLASYEVDGESYLIKFWAKDFDDADEHVLGMLESMELYGQMLSTRAAHH